jgi:hypothetical protein
MRTFHFSVTFHNNGTEYDITVGGTPHNACTGNARGPM